MFYNSSFCENDQSQEEAEQSKLSPDCIIFFFFNDTATTEIYTLSLHDALPISATCGGPTQTIHVDFRKPGGSGTYSWVPSTGLSATNIANPIASPTATTTYTVTIRKTHVSTPVTRSSRITSSAYKKK